MVVKFWYFVAHRSAKLLYEYILFGQGQLASLLLTQRCDYDTGELFPLWCVSVDYIQVDSYELHQVVEYARMLL